MYIIYAGDEYYPRGGANDIVGYYDTYDLTLQKFQQIVHSYDWIQVLDIDTKEIVKYYYKND
jgi:hypothetical protein|tara:strand:+ start:2010 stop:2195 length:186 start_codon:yes stop_codon:yes gene_type:complete